MNKPVFTGSRTTLALALAGSFALAAGAAQAQPPRTLADCRAIQGELARYACYESLEVPAADASAPAASAPPAPAATPVTPPRPVSNLPVVRRPSTSMGDLTGEAAPVTAGTSSGAVVREQAEEEKPGLLRRLLPFGGDDDEAEADDEAQVAEAAPAAPASDVDSFGLGRDTSGARVETDEDGNRELVDTVASVKQLGQNMLEVTLTSGQVWRQMLSKRYPVSVGDTVTIRPTRWGSAYRLTSERASGFIQVQRVK